MTEAAATVALPPELANASFPNICMGLSSALLTKADAI